MLSIYNSITVSFRFFGPLKDFLLPQRRNRRFFHAVKGNPSIKDTIEALGVPHPEVEKTVVNGRRVTFSYQLRAGDKIAVYPQGTIRKKQRPKFILDVHLGKLVRHLRLLGFDSTYRSDLADAEIVHLAQEEGRIILTRDICLLKNGRVKQGYWVRSILPAKQIAEVIKKFALIGRLKPFSRCLECNGKIKQVPKANIEGQLPLKVRTYYDKFYLCGACRKVYWQGSHYVKLDKLVKKIRNAHRS